MASLVGIVQRRRGYRQLARSQSQLGSHTPPTKFKASPSCASTVVNVISPCSTLHEMDALELEWLNLTFTLRLSPSARSRFFLHSFHRCFSLSSSIFPSTFPPSHADIPVLWIGPASRSSQPLLHGCESCRPLPHKIHTRASC